VSKFAVFHCIENEPSGDVALFLTPPDFFCFRRRFDFRSSFSLLLLLSLSESSDEELKQRKSKHCFSMGGWKPTNITSANIRI
jgi:hypothetical protein